MRPLFLPNALGLGVEPIRVLLDADERIELDVTLAEIDRHRSLRSVDRDDGFRRFDPLFGTGFELRLDFVPRDTFTSGRLDRRTDLVDEVVVSVERFGLPLFLVGLFVVGVDRTLLLFDDTLVLLDLRLEVRAVAPGRFGFVRLGFEPVEVLVDRAVEALEARRHVARRLVLFEGSGVASTTRSSSSS